MTTFNGEIIWLTENGMPIFGKSMKIPHLKVPIPRSCSASVGDVLTLDIAVPGEEVLVPRAQAGPTGTRICYGRATKCPALTRVYLYQDMAHTGHTQFEIERMEGMLCYLPMRWLCYALRGSGTA